MLVARRTRPSPISAVAMWHLLTPLLLLQLGAAEPQYGYGPYGPYTTSTTPGSAASAAAAPNVPANSPSTFGTSSRSAVIAHATLGALATMLLLPLGVMAARSRALTRGRGWFPAHMGVQVLSLGCVVAAFGVAWAHFRGGLSSPHRVSIACNHER